MGLLTQFDNVDDRREIWHLLHNLSPFYRVKFVEYCCQLAIGKLRGVQLDVSDVFDAESMKETVKGSWICDRENERLTNVLYYDILALACQWKVDLSRVVLDLEQVVKRPSHLSVLVSSVARPVDTTSHV